MTSTVVCQAAFVNQYSGYFNSVRIKVGHYALDCGIRLNKTRKQKMKKNDDYHMPSCVSLFSR